MGKNRLEAFSDGVIAILITIMVLELHTPTDATFAALLHIAPKIGAYLLSFVFLGIYWNNHHHMIQAVNRVNGAVLWANLHLLFWLSLVPFGTAWIGSSFGPVSIACYGVLLFASGCAYFILSRLLVRSHGKDSTLGQAIGKDRKGVVSVGIYAAAIPLAFVSPWISCALYIIVALMWLVPDRRIEHQMTD